MELMLVTREVSKLSGWLNASAFCGVSKGGHTMLGEVRASRREAAGDRGEHSVQERARLQIGVKVRGGARLEHLLHVRDAGGDEAQRLVERRRFLRSVERRVWGAEQGIPVGRREASDATAAHASCRRGLDCRSGAEHGEERT